MIIGTDSEYIVIILNPREIAILITLSLLLLFGLTRAGVRSALLRVIDVFFSWKIQLIVVMLLIYVALIVWCLMLFGLWGEGQVKSTIVWFVAVGIANLDRLPQVREGDRFFRYWLRDHLKLILIIEFIIGFYTFDIWVELIMQPFLFLVFGMLAVASSEEKYKDVKRFLNFTVAAFGFAVLGYAIYKIVADFESFATWGNFRDFATPIILSVGTLPFFYAIHVLLTYERVFGTLSFTISNSSLRRRAKYGAVIAFGPRPALLERWQRYIATHRPKSRDDLRRAIRDVKAAKRRERTPTKVPPNEGWSPTLARGFLSSDGLITRDYHRMYDECEASSSYFEIGEGILKNNICYYIKGDELVAKQLKLVLNLNDPEQNEAVEGIFFAKAAVLLGLAMPERNFKLDAKLTSITIEHWRVSLDRQHWGAGTGEYELALTVEVLPKACPNISKD